MFIRYWLWDHSCFIIIIIVFFQYHKIFLAIKIYILPYKLIYGQRKQMLPCEIISKLKVSKLTLCSR